MYSRNKCYIKKIRPNIFFQLVIQKKAIMKAYLKHSSPVNRYNCYFLWVFFLGLQGKFRFLKKKSYAIEFIS